MPSTLSSLQRRWGSVLDEAIRGRLSSASSPPGLAEMLSYQLGYTDAAGKPARATTGKRFRPILCLLACEAAGGNWQSAMIAAVGIELLHNFSLIHDDIEDRDPARRHRPTVWKVWGEPQAVNAGDSMFAMAFEACLSASADTALALTLSRRFEHTARSLTHGQYLDMSFETRQDVTPEEYIRMIDLKTGELIRFSVWSGVLLAGASMETADIVAEFGGELGRAFQIRDDIMGIWGSSSVTGKEVAKDVVNRKKTLPVLLAQESATGDARVTLNDFYRGCEGNAAGIVDILSAAGARERSAREVRERLDAARTALARARLPSASLTAQLSDLSAELTGQTT